MSVLVVVKPLFVFYHERMTNTVITEEVFLKKRFMLDIVFGGYGTSAPRFCNKSSLFTVWILAARMPKGERNITPPDKALEAPKASGSGHHQEGIEESALSGLPPVFYQGPLAQT